MNIGQAAARSRLPVKTIRYYEEIDLIRPERGDNGYRSYSDDDIRRLAFLQRARHLGFSIEECRTLLSLYRDRNRASAEVRSIARAKIAEIDDRIACLKDLRKHLADLVADCRGDHLPVCPIIDDLAGGSA